MIRATYDEIEAVEIDQDGNVTLRGKASDREITFGALEQIYKKARLTRQKQ